MPPLRLARYLLRFLPQFLKPFFGIFQGAVFAGNRPLKFRKGEPVQYRPAAVFLDIENVDHILAGKFLVLVLVDDRMKLVDFRKLG
jgi:hypothetical protein